MLIPAPPFPALSANGDWLAVVHAYQLTLLHAPTGALSTCTLPFFGNRAVFSPSGARLAVTGSESLALFQNQGELRRLAAITPPAGLFSLALSEDGLLVGTARFSDARTTLCAWRGDALTAASPAGGYPLGAVAAYRVMLNAAENRVLLTGSTGPGAYSGGARRFVGLIALQPDSITVLWKGEGLPFEPDGYLYPLVGGRFAAYRRDLLAIASLHGSGSAGAALSAKVDAQYALAELETVALAPDGTHAAWMWGSNPDQPVHVRVARLADGAIVNEGSLPGSGAFPAIAVNATGRVTLAYSHIPDQLTLWTLADGRFEKHFDQAVPNFRAPA